MSTATTASVPAAVRRKAVLAAAIGNFIEWFEFTLYGFFAAAIAANFFAVGEAGPSLFATFAAFGVSFVLRPLGALIFGHFGDRMGRRTTLSVAILGMSGATFVIGVLPTYASIGLAAPLLLVVARVVQGFSAGGEFGGATAYMVEYAPAHRRAFYASWQFFTQFFAGFVAAVVGAALSTALSAEDLNAWGWRLPFLLTLPLGFIGLYLRLRLDETPEFKEVSEDRSTDKAPLLTTVKRHWPSILKVMGLLITGTTSVYMIEAFLPAFLVEKIGMPSSTMFASMLVGIGLKIVLIPLWALASDRLGRRKPFLIASPLLLAITAVPIYVLLLQATFLSTMTAYIILAVVLSPMSGTLAIAVADAFPTRVRYSGLSIAYSTSVSIFGGFSPLILTTVVTATGNNLAAAYYLTATAVVSLIAALWFSETGPRAGGAEGERSSLVRHGEPAA